MLLAFGPGTTALGLLVRLFTRRPGQRWVDVPGHVALLFPHDYDFGYTRIEALGSGVTMRYVRSPEPGERVIEVDLHDPETARRYATEQVYESYDWAGILIGALCLLCPRWFVGFAQHYNPPYVWTCSRLAAAVLFAGGGGLVRSDAPPTPNDVLEFVQCR